MLTAAQLAQRLGISADEVEELAQQYRVLAVTLNGEIRYPAFQVGPRGTLSPCIHQVLTRLSGAPLTAYRILMSKAHDGTGRGRD
ncbi:MAG: hypothetical protein ACJASC_003510 [Limimaricola cinnabarinus]|jgi:hypothetical protein